MITISGSYGKLKTWVKSQLHTDHQSASAESGNFKEINIAINEAYKQANDIILRIKELNLFVGVNAGKINTGSYNSFVGYEAGYSNTTGHHNNFMGCKAGYSNTTGYRNSFVGYEAGYSNTTGYSNTFTGFRAGQKNVGGYTNNFMGMYSGRYNTAGHNNNFMGIYSGYSNITGHDNCFVGSNAGYYTTDGNENTFIGSRAGALNAHGDLNVFIGRYAGYYETLDNKLYIDNAKRADIADARIKALVYGIFNAATANQLFRLNAILELTEIKSGSTQANAGAAANEVWKTTSHASLPDNVLIIGV